jgi:hypothetical protein
MFFLPVFLQGFGVEDNPALDEVSSNKEERKMSIQLGQGSGEKI